MFVRLNCSTTADRKVLITTTTINPTLAFHLLLHLLHWPCRGRLLCVEGRLRLVAIGRFGRLTARNCGALDVTIVGHLLLLLLLLLLNLLLQIDIV